jgi:hypothetical protein
MEHKEVIEYYNNGQDEIVVKNIDNKNVVFNYNPNTGNYRIYKIGFYEWLFNPKYKVFEVFFKHNTHKWNLFDFIKAKPQEILDYLKNQTKGDV